LKKHILTFLKFAVPLAIIIWLAGQIDQETFSTLQNRPKNWTLLIAGLSLSFIAVCITLVRWYLLVKALEMKFRLRDAFRLGFLSFLLNFVSVGSVGGDLFKAFFIAREQPRRRAEAVATVVVDRVFGLYALLLVTTLAILTVDLPQAGPEVIMICRLTLVGSAVGGIGILLMLIPGFTSGSLSEFLSGLPLVGPTLHQLINAIRMYRRKPGILLTIGVMSLAVHSMFALSIYLLACGLFDDIPSLAEHLIIVPLSMVAGAIPFTPAGLGTFEYALEFLYQHISSRQDNAGQGLLVALAYRVVTVMIAIVGIIYYWTSRREVNQVLHDVELEQNAQTDSTIREDQEILHS